MNALVYLDNNASTRVDPRVVDAMTPLLLEDYANPSSQHRAGAAAAAHVERARAVVAQILGARDGEIVFTGSGTEASNTALRGAVAARPERRHVVVTGVEHVCVQATAHELERTGVEVTRVAVDARGRLDLDGLARCVRDDTAVVAVMLANNETGIVHPVASASRVAHARGALVYTDAVQAVGKIDVDVRALEVDLLGLSAHKFHGPKGVGALYARSGTPLAPLILGGPHERGRRAGTLNAAGIVGLARALELACGQEGVGARARVRAFRDRMEREVKASCDDVFVVGEDVDRLDNTSCICFADASAEALLVALSEQGVCASSGAACGSGALEPSHVLAAMGVAPRLAMGQVRFSLSRFSTDADVDRLLEVLPDVLRRARALGGRCA